MFEYHDPPAPATCEVCRWCEEHPEADRRIEHTMTEVAISYLLADLGDLGGGPTHLRGIAVDSIGVEPGPVHPIEPRHWYWALIEYPDFAIVVRGSTT